MSFQELLAMELPVEHVVSGDNFPFGNVDQVGINELVAVCQMEHEQIDQDLAVDGPMEEEIDQHFVVDGPMEGETLLFLLKTPESVNNVDLLQNAVVRQVAANLLNLRTNESKCGEEFRVRKTTAKNIRKWLGTNHC